MPTRWNKQPFEGKTAVPISGRDALQSGASFSVLAVLVGYAYKFRYLWLPMIGRGSGLHLFVEASALVSFILSIMGIINALLRWNHSRGLTKQQEAITPTQRKLLGLPPSSSKKKVPPPAAAGGPAPTIKLPSTITPPQRTPPEVSPGFNPMSFEAPGSAVTPASTRSSIKTESPSRRTPYSAGRAVATPEQLRRYTDNLFRGEQAEAPINNMGYSPMDPYSPYALYQSYYEQGDTPSTTPLPLGKAAPTYQPSRVLGPTAAAPSVNNALQPSSDREIDEFLKVLRVNKRELKQQVELLREWLAVWVLQSLRRIRTAHEEVNRQLENFPHISRIPSLLDVLQSYSSTTTALGSAPAEEVVKHLLHECAKQTPQARAQNINVELVLNNYWQLLQVLKGHHPRDLLPPVPPTYIASRIEALASGPILKEYQWNGGGALGGRPWTSELPTDSALLLYLFAAFLECPRWEFLPKPEVEADLASSRGMPLYVGQIPPRPPHQYSAILNYRPEKVGKSVDLIIATDLNSSQPLYSYQAQGSRVTFTGSDGVFLSILVFLLYHKELYDGMMGAHLFSDEHLQLHKVLEPPQRFGTIPQRVYNWWFPPTRPGLEDEQGQ